MAAPISASAELNVSPEIAFSRICAVQTWPVWLSFVKRAELGGESALLNPTSDIVLVSDLSDGAEEVFEVEEYIEPYLLTLVGAFSCRRRIQFRVESVDKHARVVVKIACPSRGGLLRRYTERLMVRRRIHTALVQSLQTFKGLVEHDAVEREERMLALTAY